MENMKQNHENLYSVSKSIIIISRERSPARVESIAASTVPPSVAIIVTPIAIVAIIEASIAIIVSSIATIAIVPSSIVAIIVSTIAISIIPTSIAIIVSTVSIIVSSIAIIIASIAIVEPSVSTIVSTVAGVEAAVLPAAPGPAAAPRAVAVHQAEGRQHAAQSQEEHLGAVGDGDDDCSGVGRYLMQSSCSSRD